MFPCHLAAELRQYVSWWHVTTLEAEEDWFSILRCLQDPEGQVYRDSPLPTMSHRRPRLHLQQDPVDERTPESEDKDLTADPKCHTSSATSLSTFTYPRAKFFVEHRGPFQHFGRITRRSTVHLSTSPLSSLANRGCGTGHCSPTPRLP